MAEFTEFPLNLNETEAKSTEKTKSPEKAGRRKGLSDVVKLIVDAMRRGRIDLTFLLMIFLLTAVGLVMLLSASFASSYYETLEAEGGPQPAYYFIKQLEFAVLGVVALFAVSLIPMQVYKKLSGLALMLSLALLVGVILRGLGENGAVRWIRIGPINFQPSELAKAAMIICFAKWTANLGPRMRTFKLGFLPFILTIIVFALLLLCEPHLSATLIIFGVGLILMWVGGTRWYYIFGTLLLAYLAYLFVQNNREALLKITDKFEYIYTRLDAWLYTYDREKVSKDQSWQIIQSLNAVGSGGLLGLGFGQSRQKYLYLPEEHNDYIFAIICEELGFVGATLILLLFAILIIRGYWLALHCKDIFTRMMVVGMITLLAVQVFLNVAVVTNSLPSTGISLPFFSYGGTALIVQMAEMGIVLSASRDIPDK